MNIINISLAIYGLEKELERELTYRSILFKKHDRLYFLSTDYRPLFAQVTWINCQTLPITSISDGAKKLRNLGRNWALFSINNHRRANLIQESLPKVADNQIQFLAPQPTHPMGGWTLLDANTIVCSPETTSNYPLGKVEFVENKVIPPSRAYLKLWEFFTLHCQPPVRNTHVIDLGSSPGGWSWVLADLGLNVTSVDKAPLDQHIAQMPTITFLAMSAFSIDPAHLPTNLHTSLSQTTWLFSDIICYPERLLDLIKKWMTHSNVDNFVCTIKFQGEADFAIIDEFLKIPDSKMVHLYHNKHEVMWWLQR